MIIQIYAIWINKDTTYSFGIYIKPEIIEERNAYNLSFIEEKLIFESDDDNNSVSSTESSTSSTNSNKN